MNLNNMAGEKPYVANGTTSDPREQIMWEIYISKLSKGIDNAYESATKAGYSEDHSRNITMQGWYKERKAKLKRKDMLSKAERNLDRVLDYSTEDIDGKVLTAVASLVIDVSKTIVKTLGKEDYSERQEVTGKDGKDLPTPILGYVQNNNSLTENNSSN